MAIFKTNRKEEQDTHIREKKRHIAPFFHLLFFGISTWRLGLLVAAHCRSLKRPLNQLAVGVTDPASWLEKNKKRVKRQENNNIDKAINVHQL